MDRQHLSLDRSTFGAWKCVTEFLASNCKKLLDKNPQLCINLYGTSNPEVFNMLTSTEVINAIQAANSIRNTWSGHAGVVSNRQAEEIHMELMELLQSCRSAYGRTWKQFELIQPLECRFSGGIFHYRVRRISGTRIPFEIVEKESIEGLEDNSLYLFDPNSEKGLRILPFIRIMPSPRTETNACYFYSRRQDGGFRYVSYHFDVESDLTESFQDTIDAFQQLDILSQKLKE